MLGERSEETSNVWGSILECQHFMCALSSVREIKLRGKDKDLPVASLSEEKRNDFNQVVC